MAVTSRQRRHSATPTCSGHGSLPGSHHGVHHSALPAYLGSFVLVQVHSWPCRLQFDSSQPDAGKPQDLTDPNVNFGRWFFNTLKPSVVSACCTGTHDWPLTPSRMRRRQARL